MSAAAERAPLRGFAFLSVTALAWGVNWPVMKLLMRDWPPFIFRIFAASGAVALLLLVAAAQGEALWPRRGQWGRLVASALLNVTPFSFMAPISLFWLDASEAAIIAYTMPVWAVVLAWPVLGERPTPARLAGLAIGLSGVALLMAGTLGAAGAAALSAKLPGVAAILCCAVMFAGGAVFAKRWPVQMAPLPLTAWSVAIGTLPCWVAGLAFEHLDLARVTGAGWACLAYVTVAAQGLAYLTWFRALRLLPAGTAAMGALLVPVVGVLSSGVLLDEPLGLRHAAALLLTLGGVVLAARQG